MTVYEPLCTLWPRIYLNDKLIISIIPGQFIQSIESKFDYIFKLDVRLLFTMVVNHFRKKTTQSFWIFRKQITIVFYRNNQHLFFIRLFKKNYRFWIIFSLINMLMIVNETKNFLTLKKRLFVVEFRLIWLLPINNGTKKLCKIKY